MQAEMMALQAALVSAFAADASLVALIGADGVVDAPPRGREAPYVTIARHDCVRRDGLDAPGTDHRLTLHAWAARASRKAALEIAARLEAVAGAAALSGGGILVTHRVAERCETEIDLRTGRARAMLRMRFLAEPA
jgi:hypothetical protein